MKLTKSAIFASVLTLCLLTGCGKTSCKTSDDSTSPKSEAQIAKDVVASFFEEGYVNHNYDYIMNCVAEDYVDHSPASARSNSDAVGILKIVEKQFPDLEISILDIFAEDGMVATRIRFSGTHSDTCQNIPPTGRRITFEALENFRVSGNKIVESWGYWPDDEIRRQLSGN